MPKRIMLFSKEDLQVINTFSDARMELSSEGAAFH